jgi:hypothetical protein
MIDPDNTSSLGVTVSLSVEAADRLRQHQPPRGPPQEKLTFLSPRETTELVPSSDDPLDDWNELLVIPNNGIAVDANEQQDEEDAATTNDKKNDQAAAAADNDNDNDDDDDDDVSVMSDSPPPHMPVVVVDVQRLVGYRPSSQESLKDLEHQIHAALWYGSAEAADLKTGGNPQEDTMQHVLEAAQHFDRRVTELFDTGAALHETTEQVNNNNILDDVNDKEQISSFVVVPYPEFQCALKENNDPEAFAPRTVQSTAQMWKRLLRPHPIPAVATLLHKLETCHRSLVWKHAMHRELWILARGEEAARQRRYQQTALEEWKTCRRQHQLEQLYQVRETMGHRLEMAKAKVAELEQLREQAVALEIRRRRMERGGMGGLEAVDLNSTILAFPDMATTWLGLEDDDDDYDEQIGPSFVSDDEDPYEYDGGESDADGDHDEEGGDLDDEAEIPLGPTTITATINADTDAVAAVLPPRKNGDKKARSAALAKKRRRRLQEAAKEADHQSKLDRAKTEEEMILELCTTNDLKMAQAIKAAVKKKMESVDGLLESLQEEVWAEEEDEENGKPLVPAADDNWVGTSSDDFSLLDQVLAMILGSFPPPRSSNQKDAANILAKHTQQLQAEHNKIVKDWKDHFGRLPSSLLVDGQEPSARPSVGRQSKLRDVYGIEENEAGDWDDADSDNDDARGSHDETATATAPPQPQSNAAPLQPRSAKVGLRPGGRV